MSNPNKAMPFHDDLEQLTRRLNGSLGTLGILGTDGKPGVAHASYFYWTCGNGWKVQNRRDRLLFSCDSKEALMGEIRKLLAIDGPVTAQWDWINDRLHPL